MTILEQAKDLLRNIPLCDHCLGRQFAILGHGLSNADRGHAVKLLLTAEGDRLLREGKDEGKEILTAVAENGFDNIAKITLLARNLKPKANVKECFLCRNAFNNLDTLAKKACKRLSKYDYGSFLVGIHIPPEIEEREDELRAQHNLSWGESARNAFSREIGKRIQTATGKDVDLRRPDIVLIINPFTQEISVEVNSIFILGTYRKLARDIPQSRWLCSHCQGRGCERCEGTGKLYQESVEEYIGVPAIAIFEGMDYRLHAAGREDIDVRTLGPGRPFVLEVFRPKRRTIDLTQLTAQINSSTSGKVEVDNLKLSSKEEVRKLKGAGQTAKTYRAVVEFDRDIEDKELERLKETFTGKPLSQLTPTRVSHRRALKLRKKYIYELETRRLQPNRAEILLRCQGGLYVKEFISGDEGRTKPSVAEILNVPVKCIELDVIDIDLGEKK